MKVAIFGATGGTGRIIVRKALERGHEVTAAARNPSALSGDHERLRVVEADVMQPRTLEAVVEGQDAAITSVSVGNALKEGRRPTTLFSEGARNVIAAMEGQGVGRLVCLSSGAVEPDPALGIVFGKIMRPLLFKEMYADMSRMERGVRNSGLDRIIVRPSTLTDDPAAADTSWGSTVSRRGGTFREKTWPSSPSTSSTTTATSGEPSPSPQNRCDLLRTPSGRSSGNNPSRYSGE